MIAFVIQLSGIPHSSIKIHPFIQVYVYAGVPPLWMCMEARGQHWDVFLNLVSTMVEKGSLMEARDGCFI